MASTLATVMRWPAWIQCGLLAALPIFVVTGGRMAWAIVTGPSPDGVEGVFVLAQGTLAGFCGGAVYGLFGRRLAQWGRLGSTLAGGIAVFTFFVGCSFAFGIGRVDGFVVGFGVSFALLGGWILNLGGMEREILGHHVRHLATFCRTADASLLELRRDELVVELERHRRAVLEIEGSDDAGAEDGDGDPEDPLADLEAEVTWLRATSQRTRSVALRALLERDPPARAAERFLDELEAALRALRRTAA